MEEDILKYCRTPHVPWSNATDDDKIAKDISGVIGIETIITEKIDGENSGLNYRGLYARSRMTETKNPWATWLKPIQRSIQKDLDDFNLEICGENVYGIHSIGYSGLDTHFYVFAIRNLKYNTFLSWDETEYYANLFDFKVVPVLFKGIIKSEDELKIMTKTLMNEPSKLSNNDIWVTKKEGFVIRDIKEFPYDEFHLHCIKFVREGHIKSDEHWTKNWKRALLEHELKALSKDKIREMFKKEIEKGIICL